MTSDIEKKIEEMAKAKSHEFADYVQIYGQSRTDARQFYVEGFKAGVELIKGEVEELKAKIDQWRDSKQLISSLDNCFRDSLIADLKADLKVASEVLARLNKTTLLNGPQRMWIREALNKIKSKEDL